jgi:AmmeMemoRadiSam system protein A
MPYQDEHPLVRLARQTIEEYIRHDRVIAPPTPLPPEMQGQAGAFVSLHRKGQLRGCIGTFMPTQENIALEVINNAIAAATRDPRFPPLTPQELNDLEISVDVLSPPEEIASLRDLDPRRYGVIVQSGWRRGLLLPDLEGIDTPEQQVQIACRKAGIAPGEHIRLFRFTVQRYH